jgi:iron(II)-dependent oxidoreductase
MIVDKQLLLQQQQKLLQLIKNVSAHDFARQFHPDLSPPGWHLGHCVFTEMYWLREVVMQMEILGDELRQLYIPEFSVKKNRASVLPSQLQVCEWAEKIQGENIDYIAELVEAGNHPELMQDNYLIFFLSQHYAQHIETVNYILTQKHLQTKCGFKVEAILKAAPLQDNYRPVEDVFRHYDNECPGFTIALDEFHIADRAVSNAEFVSFIEANGYQERHYWEADGWLWCEQNAITCPQHWRLDEAGNYYGTNASGAYKLQADNAVSGISYYEAKAFAVWAKARLPHEYEWETAKKKGLLKNTGQVWEWCDNSFHPYKGFRAFPYDGYSLPWFDQAHFSLRGGCGYTHALIKRDSFRNFYQADKRHFPAGLRLATD